MNLRRHRFALAFAWLGVILSFLLTDTIWLQVRNYGDLQPMWPFLTLMVWPFVHIVGHLGIQQGWPLLCALYLPLPMEAALLTLGAARGRFELVSRLVIGFQLAAFVVASLIVWHDYSS
jgi:hypothetical protein